MIVNRQNKFRVNLAGAREFVRRLRRALQLGRRDFNICFFDDREIKRLNAAHRGRNSATDVLSFPWNEAGKSGTVGPKGRAWRPTIHKNGNGEFAGFLGDIAISVESARRNARQEGHSTAHELRWLMLHGLLHLLGYDHETDRGEMTSRELALRERLGIAGHRSRGAQRHRGIQ